MTEFSIAMDTRQLRRAARAFRDTVAKDVRDGTRRELRAVGEELRGEALAAARVRVDPAAVRVRTSGLRAVVAVTKNDPEPHRGKALAFENAGRDGKFRHPVFGNRQAWVDQDAAPYLTPAAEAGYPRFQRRISEIVDRALASVGFH